MNKTDAKNAHRLQRRRFLAGAAAAGAPCLIPSGALAAGGKPGAGERLTVAHVGVGGRGLATWPPRHAEMRHAQTWGDVGETARGAGKGRRLLAPGDVARDARRARLRHSDHERPAFASLVASSLRPRDCSDLHRFAPHCMNRGRSIPQMTLMTQIPVHAVVSSVIVSHRDEATGVRRR